MKSPFKSVFIIAALLATAPCLSAAVTYTFVDATPDTALVAGNTTLNGALIDGTNVTIDSSSTTDGFWDYRGGTTGAPFTGGNMFESDGGKHIGDSEVTDPLITTITLGVAGTYNLLVVFDGASNRDVAAEIGSAPTTANNFTPSNSTIATAYTWTGLTNTRTGSTYAGSLGNYVSTTDNETVSIYINGLSTTVSNIDQRTQYDGIGYALVPEPSSALLGGFGLLALLRRRRN